jgi:beta-hydroxylase
MFVDGVKCVWRDGEGFLFDETFIHRVHNATDQNRLILFCDIERPMKFAFMTRLNHWVSEHVVKASATQNVEGEKVGALNKAFSYLYEIHKSTRRLKDWNRTAYYGLKYSVMTAIAGFVVLSVMT